MLVAGEIPKMIKTIFKALAAVALTACSTPSSKSPAACPQVARTEKIGVVLMHCKDEEPDKFIDGVASALAREGYLVVTPEMPWSHRRRYDKSYEDALIEIDHCVEDLRARGAKRIVIAGHSLGANAALRYGATRDRVAGIMMLGPGQSPEWTLGKMVATSIEKAKTLVASGHGEEVATFDDSDQGARISVRATAKIYMSYFDPEGAAVMSKNAAQLKPGTPLLFIVGKKDRFYGYYTKAYAVDRAPMNPMNRFLEVSADHRGTPNQSIDAVLDWLHCL